MAFQRTEGMSIIQALAMTVAEIPVFLYTTFGQSAFSQLRLTPGLRKVLFATALGTVALALAAHQLKRRRRRKKQIAPGKAEAKPTGLPVPVLPTRRVPSMKKGYSGRHVQSPSGKSNDTLSGISSIDPSKHSSSSHSLASITAANPSSSTPALAGPWEVRPVEDPVAAGDCSAENLYFQGMELFEEALQKWEQALTVRQRDHISPSITWDSPKEQELLPEALPEQEAQKREFAEKLESLLHRAYNLQEDFGSTLPADSMLLDLERTLMFPLTEESLRLRADNDEDSLTSEDSFFSAAELFDSIQIGDVPFQLSKPVAAYEEALRLVKEGRVSCRTFRTELLGCYSDHDFLAKLQCVRQAFQELLQVDGNQLFFAEVGKRMVMGLMIKAEKNTKGFLESYDEMLRYTLRPETWPTTQKELEGRGVVCMSFFDIVLDFILMDAFEDLENPPSSVLAVLRNRWLSDSFKETALATACWSVLKAKRRLLMVPDGFISHFYSVSEHVSPVLAFGFLGPKEHLSEVCSFFKHQILQYLKDMFDLDIVRYSTVLLLAEDILQLSRRRSEILLGYLGVETTPEMNGTLPSDIIPFDEFN
ncbi:mitoguardin 2 isoform X1 [Rhineura floridana]|uniref:mitoguardin 2 isoform X1 n=1 Tax=Rhineura floridana TaxID=261503 RepID=UPI002AC865BD|nr:mitoguardin 2 isoform X1 [Rhineura floridana]XP_061460353.1 mitoguardin 2 isoform X1 [Rhineura floridana]XP_061460354.1 mitoguardin 2 isoform X1 [Rhineura floridana]XP_061460355.1 mitoguardin 2 isoform X1 [Rhineura floridana]XP_061460356.1 mitoguardin 2 isoform X1 [Rhineura floridana]XP_061460357.1 mitoguardin 2 isoform X1 [Rhineura floridana]XP_061460358.1 mitoguardin 2 isoform X1 [Rhineura floridana]